MDDRYLSTAIMLPVVGNSRQSQMMHKQVFGIHHNSQLNAFNLADDLIEPFRPIIDLVAYKNKGFGKLLDSLNLPVMVIKEGDNKIIVFTEQFDYKGREIIVPIEINTNSEYNTIEVQDINVLKSMHGRSSIKNYINNLISKSANILYKNTKKYRVYLIIARYNTQKPSALYLIILYNLQIIISIIYQQIPSYNQWTINKQKKRNCNY